MTTNARLLTYAGSQIAAWIAIRAAQAVMAGNRGGELLIMHPDGVVHPRDWAELTNSRSRESVRVASRQVSRAVDPVEDVVRAVKERGCDLIVTVEEGMLTQRLMRAAPCSVLVLPMGPLNLDKDAPILVPVEVDESERYVVRFAKQLAETGRYRLSFLVVYSVGPGYHTLGRTREQQEAEIRKGLRSRLESWVTKELGSENIEWEIVFREGNYPAGAILDAVRTGRYSQVVLGSPKQTAAARFIFPSTAERVVLSAPCPVWAVRTAAEPVGVLQQLWA